MFAYMLLSPIARIISANIVALGLSIAGGSSLVRAAAVQGAVQIAQPVKVHGVVFDSLTHAPLAGARVAFVRADSLGTSEIASTTSSTGAFETSLPDGRWVAAIEHPRFDSLGLNVPARLVEIRRATTATIRLATPSSNTMTRLLCGQPERAGDVALVGMVRTVSNTPLDSAAVLLQWLDVTWTRDSVGHSTTTRIARTQRGGWYTLCGVPGGATALVWAEYADASTGTVVITATGVPIRLDLTLDTTAARRASAGENRTGSSTAEDTTGHRPPALAGSARYRAVVRDLTGRPIPRARARVIGHRYYLSNDSGVVALDSLPLGSQTLEVLALGYAPVRRTLDVVSSDAPLDSIVLAGAESLLDTIRVSAGRDPTGFGWRRSLKVGQFITVADIERENPRSTTSLIRTRDAMRYTSDQNGRPFVAMTAGPRRICRPFVLLDGFPVPAGPPSVTGVPSLDWSLHPDEIGGVEIYVNPSQVPPQFATFKERTDPNCGVVVFWTRQRLGIPQKVQVGPP